MKQFEVPIIYRSPLISAIKQKRRLQDKLKKDFSPTLLDFGDLKIYLARHFGFCYGVENAIEIAFRTIEENVGKRIFLLSEMIHNPQVNADLQERGVQFLMDTYGHQLIGFDELSADDVVIIPAFGTTLEIENKLSSIGLQTQRYNTTCPFVEKVWNRAEAIGKKGYTVIVHGKPRHEETRATFSHAAASTPTLVINDLEEAKVLAGYIAGDLHLQDFYTTFKGRYSPGFDVTKDLHQIGVVNQTTQLASDTQAIAEYLKGIVGEERFADTRDTLCYATLDNQTSVIGLLNTPADTAIVVGGYNSSNTTHLVELCEQKLPTSFINSEEKMLSKEEILHYDFHHRQETLTRHYLPKHSPARILLTSGASCPDALVEGVIRRLAAFYDKEFLIDSLITEFEG
jgi:4-hydroxy-3-methylbut-2-en-1-yl diphosphate reductase